MDKKIFEQQLNEAFRFSAIIRGSLLNDIAVLETMIDFFLTKHFCTTNEQKRDFLTMVAPSNVITFENKRIIFKKIIEKKYPSFEKEIPDFHARLGDIREFRNKIAHYTIDISPQGVSAFIKTKNMILLDNTRKMVEIKQPEINKIKMMTAKLTNAITELLPT